jgi:hypothetical protein
MSWQNNESRVAYEIFGFCCRPMLQGKSFADFFFVYVRYASFIARYFSYEAWPSMGRTTINHNSGVKTAFSRCLQLQLGSGTRRFLYRGGFSIVMFYLSAIASVAWTTSLVCKIYLATLVSSALYSVTRPKTAEKHTNAVGPPHTPHPIA